MPSLPSIRSMHGWLSWKSMNDQVICSRMYSSCSSLNTCCSSHSIVKYTRCIPTTKLTNCTHKQFTGFTCRVSDQHIVQNRPQNIQHSVCDRKLAWNAWHYTVCKSITLVFNLMLTDRLCYVLKMSVARAFPCLQKPSLLCFKWHFCSRRKTKWNYQTELLLKLLISIVNAKLFKTVHFKRLKSTINSAHSDNSAAEILQDTV